MQSQITEAAQSAAYTQICFIIALSVAIGVLLYTFRKSYVTAIAASLATFFFIIVRGNVYIINLANAGGKLSQLGAIQHPWFLLSIATVLILVFVVGITMILELLSKDKKEKDYFEEESIQEESTEAVEEESIQEESTEAVEEKTIEEESTEAVEEETTEEESTEAVEEETTEEEKE